MNENTLIKVWSWEHAPEKYKALSRHGGDEDWVAVVPVAYVCQYIPWLQVGAFGACDVSEDQMENGDIVCIGAHA